MAHTNIISKIFWKLNQTHLTPSLSGHRRPHTPLLEKRNIPTPFTTFFVSRATHGFLQLTSFWKGEESITPSKKSFEKSKI
ncbi:hypothetical protein, partial [uncultured Campylobacter sp.]|uniref:hypothetical protein n=1 Tax=uncultured Campylobacter sp. TaxID=218934 RepID=UPI00262C98F7